MGVGGDDDTVASSLPTTTSFEAHQTFPDAAELVGGRYRIVRWLGGGGMGRVYEAVDTELDERVALKVLRSGLSEDAIERFRREVKLTRRIQHRNVARMFDIGEHNGEKFLTMELVDGEPLTRQVGATRLPWLKLKSYAEQICAGLAAAHAVGVVHRDLKPDNVLIERDTDRAVLTDFGIARSGDDPSVTQVGAIVGTPRYMAPEQLAGREVDARADLFSLGVMLFELATATRPWGGDNAISIAVAQATMAPRTIDTQTAPVPPFFAALVAACLSLDPADRPASAAEVVEALATERPPTISRDTLARGAGAKAESTAAPRGRTPTNAPRTPAAAPAPEPATVAVLPVTCAPADEYLADGLLEDLTDTLSTTPNIRVRPAGIARQATAPDARELGRKLDVDHIVAGSMRRTATGLRIATRLISVADGFQIWANKRDCTDAEVLDVADDIAKGIADALSTRASVETKPTDPRAVDLYLRARAELRRFWAAHAQTAATLLDEAVGYAPTSGPILAAAAYAHVQSWVMRSEPDLLKPAEEALARALATGHPEALLASAQYRFNRNEPERGAQDLARGLVRAPMSAQMHELAGKILLEVEGTTIARTHYETARGLDPARAAIIDTDLARIDALEHKWNDADARIEALVANPDMSLKQLGFIQTARMNMWRGRREAMIESAKTFVSRVSSNVGVVALLAKKFEEGGSLDRELWNSVLQQQLDPALPVRQFVMRFQIFCELALVADEIDAALDALTRSVELGLIDVTWMDGCPLLAKVIVHHRYTALRRTVGERASRISAAFRAGMSS